MKKLILSMFLLGTLLIVNAQVPNYVPSNGLVGWWPFNGNANDESGKGNNGTVNGASLTSDRFGIANKAYLLNSVAPGITVNNFNIHAIRFTVSYWVYYTSKPVNTFIADISHDWINNGAICSGRDIDNSINFATPGSNGTSNNKSTSNGKSESLNTWINVVLVRDSNNIFIYKDGILTSNNTNNANSSDLIKKLYFGGDPTMYSNNKNAGFAGNLDDIGIWNRSLTSSEITILHDGCKLSISSEPSNQSSSINAQAQFASLASDTTASYQWQSNPSNVGWVNLPSNSDYSGVATKRLKVSNLQVNNHKQLFRVIATKNTCKDTSAVAMLTVNDTCITNVYDTIAVQDTLIINAKLTGTIPLKTNLIKVYPNPAKDYLVIDFGNYSSMAGYSITIFDVAGKSVYSSAINKASETIDLNTWTGKGVYFIKIYNKQSQQIENRKIVIQ